MTNLEIVIFRVNFVFSQINNAPLNFSSIIEETTLDELRNLKYRFDVVFLIINFLLEHPCICLQIGNELIYFSIIFARVVVFLPASFYDKFTSFNQERGHASRHQPSLWIVAKVIEIWAYHWVAFPLFKLFNTIRMHSKIFLPTSSCW